jgi:ammonia channel protein AmtB
MTEVHGFCGIWSVISVGIFDVDKGFFYTGIPDQLGIQLVGATAYILWTGLLSFIFFYSLKKNGRLRVDLIFEIIGLDFIQHGSNNSIAIVYL